MKTIRKLVAIALLLCMALSLQGTAYAENPHAGKPAKGSSTAAAPQYGRLIIPTAGIDVGLYNSNSQATCDAQDSACFYKSSGFSGMTVADHNYQTFRTLPQAKVGDIAAIQQLNGGIIYIRCAEKYNGINTGSGLTTEDGRPAKGTHDYLTYTCISGTANGILICQWDIVGAANLSKQYDKGFSVDSKLTAKALSLMGNVVPFSLQAEKEAEEDAPVIAAPAAPEKVHGNGNGNGNGNGKKK